MSSSNNNNSYVPTHSAQLSALEKKRRELQARREQEDRELAEALAREESRLAEERKRAEEARRVAEETRRKAVEEKMKRIETEKRKRAEEEQGDAEVGSSMPKRQKMVSNKEL